MSKFNPNDFIGRTFGRLSVKSVAVQNGAKSRVIAECSCGEVKEVILCNIRNGNTSSCGCLATEILTKRNYKHGESNSRLYGIWSGMKERCNNPNLPDYKNYGGRGISVCPEWEDDFLKFKTWAIEDSYSDELTIDRIDVDKGYSPNNCRWIPLSLQARNKTNTWYVELEGLKKTAKEWCEILGTNYQSAHTRKRAGHEGLAIFDTPKRNEGE